MSLGGSAWATPTQSASTTQSAASDATTRPRAGAPLPWTWRRARSVAKRTVFGVTAAFAVCSVDFTLFSLVGVVKSLPRAKLRPHTTRAGSTRALDEMGERARGIKQP